MSLLAIIGGSGLASFGDGHAATQLDRDTPFGYASGPLTRAECDGVPLLFLPRHGRPHSLPPHRVNYRANLWALREAGARRVIAVNAVGGIGARMQPPRLVLPDQIIDYTWGRAHTFFDESHAVTHVDFARPYSAELRAALLAAARELALDLHDGGTYGATQGPRLESAAEILRLERDGCDLVGMTGMPEAGLARELGLGYAALCVVANRAAGKGADPITPELIAANLKTGMQHAEQLLRRTLQALR